jgi:hypothetical protein
MGFEVDPDALRGYARQLHDAATATDTAGGYVRRWASIGWHDRGLLSQLRTAHEQFVNNTTAALRHLKDLLETSQAAMDSAAGFYTSTDHTAAARLDASYPATPRPAPHDWD